MSRRISADRLERVAAVYQAGATLAVAARAGKCSIFTAWTHLKDAGLLRQTEVDGEAIDRALAEGLTPYEAGRRLRVNLQVVLDHIRRQ